MDLIHEPQVVCGKSGAKDLHIEYIYHRKFEGHTRPVICKIRGGGWMHGGMDEMVPTAIEPDSEPGRYLRSGIMLANLRHIPVMEAPFPANRDDINTGLDWLYANCDRLNIRKDGIAIDGGSSGAHLATLVAALRAKGPYEPLRAIILRAPPIDIASWFTQMHDNRIFNKCVRMLLGGTPQEKPDVCREATPLTHINPAMPPFLIFHGDKDEAVPPVHTALLEDALKKKGVPVTRVVVENGGHDLGPADGATSSPTLQEISDMKFAFLKKHMPGIVDDQAWQ